jgi:hypothetical protein
MPIMRIIRIKLQLRHHIARRKRCNGHWKRRRRCWHLRTCTATRCRRLTDILNAEMESFTTMRKKATDIAKP